jgi:hypothetical protein
MGQVFDTFILLIVMSFAVAAGPRSEVPGLWVFGLGQGDIDMEHEGDQ